jgi:site-specific recombinase XerC
MFDQIHLTELYVAPTLHWTEAFGAWLFANDRRPNTISAYLQDVRHFSKFFQQENGTSFEPGLLNATDVKKYFAWQDADKAVKPMSRNRRLATLRVLVDWAVESGILEYDPTISIKRMAVELSPRDRTPDEMMRLNAVADGGSHVRCKSEGHAWLGHRDHVIWLLFQDAGLRIHELAGLDVTDVDFESKKIHVLGKGGKKADVIVSSALIDAIASWLDLRAASSPQALITDWNGERITSGQIRRRLKMMGEAAGVDHLNPHDLRHNFVYSVLDTMLEQGLHMPVALDAARKQARHGDAKTTMMYLRSRESQIRLAMEAR